MTNEMDITDKKSGDSSTPINLQPPKKNQKKNKRVKPREVEIRDVPDTPPGKKPGAEFRALCERMEKANLNRLNLSKEMQGLFSDWITLFKDKSQDAEKMITSRRNHVFLKNEKEHNEKLRKLIEEMEEIYSHLTKKQEFLLTLPDDCEQLINYRDKLIDCREKRNLQGKLESFFVDFSTIQLNEEKDNLSKEINNYIIKEFNELIGYLIANLRTALFDQQAIEQLRTTLLQHLQIKSPFKAIVQKITQSKLMKKAEEEEPTALNENTINTHIGKLFNTSFNPKLTEAEIKKQIYAIGNIIDRFEQPDIPIIKNYSTFVKTAEKQKENIQAKCQEIEKALKSLKESLYERLKVFSYDTTFFLFETTFPYKIDKNQYDIVYPMIEELKELKNKTIELSKLEENSNIKSPLKRLDDLTKRSEKTYSELCNIENDQVKFIQERVKKVTEQLKIDYEKKKTSFVEEAQNVLKDAENALNDCFIQEENDKIQLQKARIEKLKNNNESLFNCEEETKQIVSILQKQIDKIKNIALEKSNCKEDATPFPVIDAVTLTESIKDKSFVNCDNKVGKLAKEKSPLKS